MKKITGRKGQRWGEDRERIYMQNQKRKAFQKRDGWSLIPNVRVQRKVKPREKRRTF